MVCHGTAQYTVSFCGELNCDKRIVSETLYPYVTLTGQRELRQSYIIMQRENTSVDGARYRDDLPWSR